MKKKNAFTIVELLSVIVIIALIAIITMYSVNAVTASIKKHMWCNKVELIIKAAEKYGEDNKYRLFSKDNKATNNVSIETLINRKYYASRESVVQNGDTIKTVIRNIDNEDMLNDLVNLKIENGVIYAEYNPDNICK